MAGAFVLLASACARPADSTKPTASLTDGTSRNACASCALELKPLLELGTPKDSVQFTEFTTRIARDSHGRIFVAPVNAGTGVAVFDSLGVLTKVLDGKEATGSSPGRLQRVTDIDVSLADTLAVYDEAQRRFVFYDPQLRPVRAVTLRGKFEHFIALQSGAIGTRDWRDAKGSSQFPFHRFDGQSGAFQRSMGDSAQLFPDAGMERVVLSANETQSGNVWVMNPLPLRLTQFDTVGKRLREFSYQPSWLPPVEQPAPMMEQADSVKSTRLFVRQIPAQPIAQMWQARVTPDERAAILLGMKPKRGWEKRTNPHRFDSAVAARTTKSDSARNAGTRLNEFNGWYDSVVEIVDLNTGKSLGTQTLPFSGNPQLLRGGYLATLDGNTDGSVRIIIWSITLATATKPQ